MSPAAGCDRAGLGARRDDQPAAADAQRILSLHLKAHNFSVDLDLLTPLDPPIIFDSLSDHTVTGTLRQPEKLKRAAGQNGGSAERIKAKCSNFPVPPLNPERRRM